MSEKYETVKKYYECGAWSIERVRKAVAKGWLTSAEYRELTGETYTG